MKKKGYTLIELLAVIIVLAIIALIAIPLILGIIEKAKIDSLENSIKGYVEAIEKEIAISEINQNNILIDGTHNILDIEINYKGEGPDKGTIELEKGIVKKGSFEIKGYYGIYRNGKAKVSKNKEDLEEFEEPVEKDKVYGIKRSLESESSEWERIEDSVGLVANAQVGTTEVQNDFDSIYPWSDIISYNYDTNIKQITATYGEDNFKFDGSNGEVLTKIPEFYYKREQKDGYEYIYISEKPKEEYHKSEEFSIGRYTMSGDATKVHSKSGVKPFTNHTISEYRNYASNLGSEFSQLDYHLFIIQLLYLVEYADYNSQTKLGPGYTNSSNTGPITSGGTDFLGMKSGSVDGSDTSSIIYRGIEDIYGNIWQFVDGINVKDNQAYICYDKNNYESDKFDGCYQPLGYVNSSIHGWIMKLGYDSNHPLIAFPTEIGGSESTYVSDEYSNYLGDRITIFGGSWLNYTSDGLFYWGCNNASSVADIGLVSRLIKTN